MAGVDYNHKQRLIIEFIAGIGLLAGAMTFPVTDAQAQIKGPLVEEQVIEAPKRKTVEELVREYFKDTPELVAVAWCESRFRQIDEDGNLHRGQVNQNDIGVMQINIVYHLETALKLDIDLYTLEGNMEYAKYLFNKQGLQPWSASKPCWERYLNQDVAQILFKERS